MKRLDNKLLVSCHLPAISHLALNERELAALPHVPGCSQDIQVFLCNY